MLRYYITDRHSAGGIPRMLGFIERALANGVERIQIREKDLPARELCDLARRVLSMPNPHGSHLLVNTRVDIALAAGAHAVEEVRAAEREGADFVVFSPIFSTISKAAYGAPIGIGKLREAVQSVHIPVLALGGVTAENAAECLAAGAAGGAGGVFFYLTSVRISIMEGK